MRVRRDRVQDSPGADGLSTKEANEVIVLEAGTAAIELSGKVSVGGVQGTDTRGFSDSLIRCQVVGYRPI